MTKLLAKAWAAVKAPVMKGIDSLQEKFPPNRLVVILTPLVFMPVSSFVAAWVAKHFPGLPAFNATEILGLEITAALGALGVAYKWIDGWQRHEEHEADAKHFLN